MIHKLIFHFTFLITISGCYSDYSQQKNDFKYGHKRVIFEVGDMPYTFERRNKHYFLTYGYIQYAYKINNETNSTVILIPIEPYNGSKCIVDFEFRFIQLNGERFHIKLN